MLKSDFFPGAQRFAFAGVIALAGAVPVVAEDAVDWKTLTGAEIETALTDRTLDYGSATQVFKASGRTLYSVAGRDSWGSWAVREDQYCSVWPPSDLWACYDIQAKPGAVRFVGAQGDITDGRYAE